MHDAPKIIMNKVFEFILFVSACRSYIRQLYIITSLLLRFNN
jgi:hypothetical protein